MSLFKKKAFTLTKRKTFSVLCLILGLCFWTECQKNPPSLITDVSTSKPAIATLPSASQTFRGQKGTLLYVTQTPVGGLDTIVSHFTNHLGGSDQAPRGGDLMIRYPDGATRNLTREVGYGEMKTFQGEKSIAVRQPTVHWDGNKALFSMVVGGVTQRFSHKQNNSFRWQIYEIEGLAKNDTPTIRKIPHQPPQANNISPIYGSDDRILFISDESIGQQRHLYPQLDEYEAQPVTTGIWSLVDAKLNMIEHSPSGVFQLTLDSKGRVIYTKWDHLQRDQMGDKPDHDGTGNVFTYTSEDLKAPSTDKTKGSEFFPEARSEDRIDYNPKYATHKFNQFYPWQINQDGSEEETLNHIGRHEWGGSYTDGNIAKDPSLIPSVNNSLYTKARMQLPGDGGLFFLSEDPDQEGWFYGVRAKEFGTGNAGSLVSMDGREETNPENMQLIPLTPAGNKSYLEHGRFRNPIKLKDGKMLSAHTQATDVLKNIGTHTKPQWNYQFRLKMWNPDKAQSLTTITTESTRTLSWYNPDKEVTWSGTLWELDPTEVRPRKRPPLRVSALPEIEHRVFKDAGIDHEEFKEWLRSKNLALITGRNVLRRDRNDKQQPFNLSVPNGASTKVDNGPFYSVSYLQILEAALVRGYKNKSGRRTLPRPVSLWPNEHPKSSTKNSYATLGKDGSFATVVPAQRALSWQLVDEEKSPTVRERIWVSFAPGEIRVCTSCHGINEKDHLGRSEPTNSPKALRALLETWKTRHN